MKTFIDHLGRTIQMPFPPKRIVSLAPAITETMYHLKLGEQVVGRTRFCIHPQPEVERAMNVGGTKDMKLERIKALDPHLIVAEKEENTKEMIEELEKYLPVFVFEIQTYEDALTMIKDLGTITNRSLEANQTIITIEKKFTPLQRRQNLRVAYVIWKNPYMVVGGNTYINSVLSKLGFHNPFASSEGRYSEVSEEDLRAANLDYIFLATEPFPFSDKERNHFQAILPKTKALIVDGEMFWYGSRMIEATDYFKQTLLTL